MVLRKHDLLANLDIQAVSLVQCRFAEKRQYAQHRNARPLTKEPNTVCKQRPVAAKLVDHEPAHPGIVPPGVMRSSVPTRMGKHTAAIDVTDQHHPSVC